MTWAWWTGWPKGAVGRALTGLNAVEVDLDEGSGWIAAGDVDDLDGGHDGADHGTTEAAGQAVAVLPALDPTTMGWKWRDHYLDPALTSELFDRNGNGGPTIWVGGRIVGGWAQRDDGELVHGLLVDVGADAERLIERELDRLAAEIGDTRYKVRFPNPLNKALRQ